MGFLSGVTERLLGGTDNSSQKAQQQANAASRQYTEDQLALSLGDINKYYPMADYARNQGYNSALGLMGQMYPQQLNLMNQGSYGAQNTLYQSMPQFQNAIMGTPVDYSQFQPRQFSYDASVFQQQLPSFTQGLTGQVQTQVRPQQQYMPQQMPQQQYMPQQMPQQGYAQQMPQRGGGSWGDFITGLVFGGR